MYLDVRVYLEQRPGDHGRWPESADEVIQSIDRGRPGAELGWRIERIEARDTMVHHVYASDGIQSVEQHVPHGGPVSPQSGGTELEA